MQGDWDFDDEDDDQQPPSVDDGATASFQDILSCRSTCPYLVFIPADVR